MSAIGTQVHILYDGEQMLSFGNLEDESTERLPSVEHVLWLDDNRSIFLTAQKKSTAFLSERIADVMLRECVYKRNY